MGKITRVNENWISIDNVSINLDSLSRIESGEFGLLEGDRYYIEATSINQREDGSENKFMIATYGEDERALWEEDCIAMNITTV